MKVLVCGGRDFADERLLSDFLCKLHERTPITRVIHGAAPGADTLAAGWAIDMGITVTAMRADWTKHGRAAGPIRNGEMLKLMPDVVVAFPGGRGTSDMMTQARRAGVRVIQVAQRTPHPIPQEK